MRTKNKKWTVPILALVPVLALAALVAVGLFNVGSAQAQDSAACGFTTNNLSTFTNTGTDDDDDVTGFQCHVIGDSATVKIENTLDTDNANIVVLVSGGSDYPGVQARTASGTGGEEIGAAGVGEYEFSIDEQDRVGRKDVPGSVTFTVTSDMAKGGEVLVVVYDVRTGTDLLEELDEDTPTWPTDGFSGSQTIIFLGKPSLTQPDAGDVLDLDDDPDPSSTFMVDTDTADASVGITAVTGQMGLYTIGADDDSQATIVATIGDVNGRLLKDGDDDIDSIVTFNYEYAMGSDLKSRRSFMGEEQVDVEEDATASFLLDEWKSGATAGAVRVTVTATYSGPTGDLDLGKIVLSRTGRLDAIVATLCGEIAASATDTKDDGCNAKQNPQMVFKKNASDTTVRMDMNDAGTPAEVNITGSPVIIVKAMDALGSDLLTGVSWDIQIPEAADDFLSDDATLNLITADDAVDTVAGSYTISIDSEEAEAGVYEITAEGSQAASGNIAAVELMETVTLIIAGDLAKYAIDGAASGRVMAGMTETFTVKALDANDNPADASGQKPNILITGPGKDAVSVLDLTSGELRPLNANGQNTFRIYVLPDAPSSHINITVLGEAGTDPVSMKVYIGSNQAPMAGAAIDDQTIEIGSMAMVQSTLSDADGQMLSYMAISSDDMVATAEVDDTGMVTITAEAVGIATITVTATDTDGAMGTQDITVTVEEANVAPMAGADIDPVMMTVGDDPMMVATMFTDANMDDMLSYTAMSDMMDVATASVDDMGMVTITAMGAGMATITVTATDMDGAYDMQTIMVTVAANMPPMGGDAIEVMMTMGDDPMMVATMFTDAEDDMLTYSAMSDMMDVATASVNDMGMVTITAMGAGMATITVTATDTQSGTGTQAIMVTVAANMGPMAGEDIADQMLYVGGDAVMVPTMFTDPEGDMLSYSVDTSDDMVATAMVDDMGMVTITPMGAGDATVTVTAMDAVSGMSAMQEIMVTVMVPMLGDPVITSAMSDAAGMATIMITPGDNATKHFVWAQPTDLSQGMYSDEAAGDATMVTFSGLTSDMNYWFIAVAGRGTGTDSEWSDWSGWTAETPIQ